MFSQVLGKLRKTEDVFYADYAHQKASQGIDQVFAAVNNIYNDYRQAKELNRQGRANKRDRYSIGIVFNASESRDDLVNKNKIPAYYSNSNIRALLREGIMPFGWNAEMAIEQGFGPEIYTMELKNKSDEKSQEFLHRESTKAHLKATVGDLKNLRDRLKTRKLIQYYSQF